MTPKAFVLGLALLLLTACGYHLRGAVELPPSLKKAYLDGASMQLREQFRKVLQASSGDLVPSAQGADIIIKINMESSDQRALSLSASGRSNELELYYRLQYQLISPDNTILMPNQPLEVKRQYFNNQQDMVAKDNEQQVIRGEMLQQAVRTMIDHMRVVLTKGK